MTVSASQPRAVRSERRIIERPRLIKLLDEADARTILLLAPAGYGKTTLAHQWAKTLNGAIWLTLTGAHRDISVLALELAQGVDQLGGNVRSFVDQYVRSRPNPQRAAREIARALAEQLATARVQWVVLDDYHELSGTPEAELFIEALHHHVETRFLIASRLRPEWATRRLMVYGEVTELTREALAMNDDESSRLVGRRRDLKTVVAQAEGWPAVLSLAVGAGSSTVPGSVRLPATLYEFFVEELYQSAPPALQGHLVQLALAPDLSDTTLAALFGSQGSQIVDSVRELGFISSESQGLELHPLIREFLLEKVASDKHFLELVRPAIAGCVDRERWQRAFDLILRFDLLDLVEPTLQLAYGPLVRSGQLGTISTFAARVRMAPTFPPAVVDLVEAEVALRDGAFQLAAQIAERVQHRLPVGHPLMTKAHSIFGQSSFVQAQLSHAERAYRSAYETAVSDEDKAEALHGWALASVQLEAPDSAKVVSALAARRHESPFDLLRFGTVKLARQHLAEGIADNIVIDEELHILDQVEDPRARSSFTALAAYVLAVRAEYHRASTLMALADHEIATYNLDFARSHSYWNNAFIALGLRRFGAAERLLQELEDATRERPLGYHILNARLLRARLSLQTGQPEHALEAVSHPNREAAIPSIHGEYLATRAVALAVLGRGQDAEETAQQAEQTSTAIEVRVLAQGARAISEALAGDSHAGNELWRLAENLGAWDPLVTAVRACPPLAELFGTTEAIRPGLRLLYERSNDLGLARKAGFRTRPAGRPSDLLSPRELEVLELLARGFRNRDVAEALVISESTTKVHVRHILEKLGVRTRAEAVARLGLVP